MSGAAGPGLTATQYHAEGHRARRWQAGTEPALGHGFVITAG